MIRKVRRLSNFEKLLCRGSLLFCISFLTGAIGFYNNIGIPVLFAFCLTASVAGLFAVASLHPKGRRAFIYYTVWILAQLFVFTGYLRACEDESITPLKAFLEKGTEAGIDGTVLYISIREDGYQIILSDSSAQIGQLSYESEKVILNCDYSCISAPKIGDRVYAVGKLYPCEKPVNPGQFDSDRYYRNRDIDARMYANTVCYVNDESCTGGTKDGFTKLISSSKCCVQQKLYELRCYISRGVSEVLPANEAGVVISMLTGDRGMLDTELKKLYSDGGIAHILSISALHVSLLGMGLYRLLMKICGRLRLCSIITITVMIFYGILTGFSVSTVRAVIMLSLKLVARMLGRPYDMLSSVAFTALVQLMICPGYVFDSGFLMSYSAVLGICAFNSLRGAKQRKVFSSVGLSLFVQLFMLPVMMKSYFSVNPYSLIINPLVIPFMSVVLVSGLLAAVLGGIAGRFFAGPVYYILKLYEYLCRFESKIPYSAILTGAPRIIAVILYYAGLLSVTLLLNSCQYEKRSRAVWKKRISAIIITAVSIFVLFLRLPDSELKICILDVGQGDAAFVAVNGRCVMIDAGSSNISSVGEYRVIPFLKYEGVKKLDSVYLSHFDMDHISAISEMLEIGYPDIGEIVVGTNSDMNTELIIKAEEKNVPIRTVCSGETEELNELRVNILAPERDYCYENSNSGSMVLELLLNDFGMLFTGDTDFDAENLYMEHLERGEYAVLKCAHHGSKYSTSSDLLKAVNPVITTVSCSKYNTYGHPSPDTLLRLNLASSTVFATYESGMIEIDYSAENSNLSVRTFQR